MTTTVIEFFHECQPPRATAQQRRHTRRGTFLPPAVLRAKAMLQAVFESHAPRMPYNEPVMLTLTWTWAGAGSRQNGLFGRWEQPKTTRPDLDNLLKLALDAMTAAGWWADDSLVVRIETAKFTGPYPGIYAKVEVMS